MLAYTLYVLDAGSAVIAGTQVALAPCVIGYAICSAARFGPYAHAATRPYRAWIAEYAGAAYQDSRRKRGAT